MTTQHKPPPGASPANVRQETSPEAQRAGETTAKGVALDCTRPEIRRALGPRFPTRRKDLRTIAEACEARCSTPQLPSSCTNHHEEGG